MKLNIQTQLTMTKAIASAVLILALLSACASTEGSGHYQGKLKPKTVYVVSDRTLDDFTIHHAIISELQKRGFRVIDSRDQAPVSPGNALVLHYLDTWSWGLACHGYHVSVCDEHPNC